MADSTTHDSLELEVNDFGPIVHAKIDLRPLTVFVGPSNTGKSYLATLIYALHRFFSDATWYDRSFRERERSFPYFWHSKLSGKDIYEVARWAEQTLIDSRGSSIVGDISISESITDIIRSVFDAQGDQIQNQIRRCFGTENTNVLIRKEKRNNARVVLSKVFANDSGPFMQELTLGSHGTEFQTSMPKGKQLHIDAGKTRHWMEILHRMADKLSEPYLKGAEFSLPAIPLMKQILDVALPQLVDPLLRPAFYLPADRTGVMNSHQVVVGALLQNATAPGHRPPVNAPLLSGILADFLEQLIQLEPQSNRRSESHDELSRQIERTILRGSVQVESPQGINYPHFTYRPIGWKESLPLKNASSMVSELAPVVLYLRDVVESGETLIIEEPEAHLHPAMQVELTRHIAAVVQAGVRVIVTTHSEWVLEELANIVRRSELTEAGRKDMPHVEFALRPEHVGAWLFKQKRRPKGSVVEEVRLDEEVGLFPTDYDAVSEALYNDSVRIFNRIQDN